MGFGEQVGRRLRRLRDQQRIGQDSVASAVGLSVSAVSRLERGLRGLRVDQLIAWAGALGLRVEVVIWAPARPDDPWDEGCAEVLAEVAAAVAHLPSPTRLALVHEMREWRAAASGGC